MADAPAVELLIGIGRPPSTVGAMRAIAWSDYLCPWCYLGHDRTRLMEQLGVEVTVRAFELHPEIPPTGVDVRPGGRLARVFDVVEQECAELGLPFRRPRRVPNSRLALETAELVARHAPASFRALDDALFDAHWVAGDDLGDPAVVDALVERAGAPVDEIRPRRRAGEGAALVDESMREAREHGVQATPAWLLGDLLVPGAQPRATIERWVRRLLAAGEPSASAGPAGRIDE